MGRLYLLFFLVNLALLVVALIDCLSSEEASIRALPKIIWVFVILLFSPAGPIVWFVAGRPRPGTGSRSEGGPVQGPLTRRRPRPLAPDDDPEFLANLSRQREEKLRKDRQRADDEQLLRTWEADLRRRERELRDAGEPGEEPPETPAPGGSGRDGGKPRDGD